jgi:hypothetical protein
MQGCSTRRPIQSCYPGKQTWWLMAVIYTVARVITWWELQQSDIVSTSLRAFHIPLHWIYKNKLFKIILFKDILLCFKNGETKSKRQILQMDAKVLVYKISKYFKLEAENGRYVQCCQVVRTPCCCSTKFKRKTTQQILQLSTADRQSANRHSNPVVIKSLYSCNKIRSCISHFIRYRCRLIVNFGSLVLCRVCVRPTGFLQNRDKWIWRQYQQTGVLQLPKG